MTWPASMKGPEMLAVFRSEIRLSLVVIDMARRRKVKVRFDGVQGQSEYEKQALREDGGKKTCSTDL